MPQAAFGTGGLRVTAAILTLSKARNLPHVSSRLLCCLHEVTAIRSEVVMARFDGNEVNENIVFLAHCPRGEAA